MATKPTLFTGPQGKIDAGPNVAADSELLTQPFSVRMAAAQQGSLSAIGSIFDECRNYLLLIANLELGQSMQAKIGASDLVQETFLQAQQVFDRFQGQTRQDLSAWLAKILEYKLAQAQRGLLKSEKRDIRREVRLGTTIADDVPDVRQSQQTKIDSETGPDNAHSDELDRLKQAIESLPADHQFAIELRSLQEQSFIELGRILNRSPEAARTTWLRALLRLRKEIRRLEG